MVGAPDIHQLCEAPARACSGGTLYPLQGRSTSIFLLYNSIFIVPKTVDLSHNAPSCSYAYPRSSVLNGC